MIITGEIGLRHQGIEASRHQAERRGRQWEGVSMLEK